MKIQSIDIEGFGIWNGLRLDELSHRATVIYGPNEAGKTTLMQFIRAVLYGFTPQRRQRYLPPVRGGQPGGRLQVTNEFGSFVIQRLASGGRQPPGTSLDERGLIKIIDDRGQPRDPAQFDALLAGVDEATYSNVFSVGLKEIQELGSLDDTAAADYLYRLTSGLDRVSLIDCIREVEAARERLLASDAKAPSHIPQLLGRRDALRGQIDEQMRHSRRYCELARQRTSLIEEAHQLDQQIAAIDVTSHLLRAALDVQEPWTARADIEGQLETLKDVRPLPEHSLEKFNHVQERIAAGRKRLRKIARLRQQLQKDLASLEVNQAVLSHAGRIEALHDQSPWISALEAQVTNLRGEVKKLDADIEAALEGYRGASPGSLDELPRETASVLRRPAQVLREEKEKLDKARQDADEAKRALAAATSQYDQVCRAKRLTDLAQAIQQATTKVTLLRNRIEIEARLENLARRRQELEADTSDSHADEEAPVRVMALAGLFFSLGVMFVLIGTVGASYDYVASGWPYTMLGSLVTGLTVLGKVFLQRSSQEHVADAFRELEQLRLALGEAKRQRDEIDAELPPASGSLDTRLREAEVEWRDLERLIPVRKDRDDAQERHQAAERLLAAAQDAMKEARHRWKNALRSVGLPEDFAPPKARQALKSNEHVLELRRRRDARKDELQQRERELLLINNRLQQTLDDVRHSCTSDQPIGQIRELIEAVAKERETLALREEIESKLRRLINSGDKVVAALRKARRQRHVLLSLATVEDEKGFRQAAADWARVVELRRQQAELTTQIQKTLAGHITEEQIAAVLQAEGRNVEAHWKNRQQQLADLRARLAELHERRGACTHEMQSLAADRQLAHRTLELNTTEVQLADAIRRWKILTVISRLLEAVRRHYETDRQPQTLREASQHLVRLTEGHYQRIWMPLDRRGLLIENQQGESLALDVLSRGTREAVFIGLRLALATSFARRGATLPLVLDDVLVNFDANRVRSAAEVLCDFARQGHQVIMFTCHQHITDIFQRAGADVRALPSSRVATVREANHSDRPLVQELPPPTPSSLPEEQESVRTRPDFDPNPLLQMAAAEEPLFDPVHPLPPKRHKLKRRRARESASGRQQVGDSGQGTGTKSPEPGIAIADAFELLAFRQPDESEPLSALYVIHA